LQLEKPPDFKAVRLRHVEQLAVVLRRDALEQRDATVLFERN